MYSAIGQAIISRTDGILSFLTKVIEDANFSTKIYLSEEVNRQNRRYWSNENPNWLSQTKMQDAGRLMEWAEI